MMLKEKAVSVVISSLIFVSKWLNFFVFILEAEEVVVGTPTLKEGIGYRD